MNRHRLSVLSGVILVLLFVGEITALAFFSRDTWYSRFGLIFQIIGVYGIGIGFVQKSDLLKNFNWLDEMTSPFPGTFVAGNLACLGLLWLLASVGLGVRSQPSSKALGWLGQILIFCMAPLLLVYSMLHLIVICPFAYIGYLFSSALVESITGSTRDMELEMTSSGESQKVRIREIVASNPAAAKSFLIGIPAILLAFVTKIIGMFLQ